MKKQWISVKCGLSRDPKHRQAMGESVWLFLHILDIASWEDGIAHDWKDEAAAEDMGMPVRTLREHRRRLAELGYISCNQKQYTQDIVIHNWTNPREYNGQVYNQKQGDSETEPRQGDTQGYIQGNRKDVTPTLYSNNKESIDDSILEKYKAMQADPLQALLDMENFPGAKKRVRVDSVLSYLGATLHKNVTSREWREFAEYVDSEHQSKGWDVKQFIEWMYGQKNFDLQYWPVKKMRENYPAAFAEIKSEIPQYKPLPEDNNHYVPNPNRRTG
jgi:hypothetical protein